MIPNIYKPQLKRQHSETLERADRYMEILTEQQL